MSDDLEQIEEDLGIRVLALSVHTDGTVTFDPEGFMGWEITGLATWLEAAGNQLLEDEMEDDA